MDDIKKNKTFMQHFTAGKAITDDDMKVVLRDFFFAFY